MPAESQPIRILIADDQRMWLEALTALLSTIPGFEVAGTVTSGEKALAFCRHNPLPDLILLDLGMPEMDGFETMEKLLASRPELKIIMLTVHEDFASIQESLQKGARGYVLKISSKEELEESIRQVYSGNRYFDARVRDIITEGMMSPVKKNGPSPLTPGKRRSWACWLKAGPAANSPKNCFSASTPLKRTGRIFWPNSAPKTS